MRSALHGSRRGPSALTRGTTLTLALVLAPVLAGCGVDSGGDDDVISGLAQHVDGATTRFVVPVGALSVTVGDPVDEVAVDEARDATAHQAPSGSELLPVLSEVDLGAAPWKGLLGAHPQESELTLTVGDEERDLGSPYIAEGAGVSPDPERMFYVTVPDDVDPADVRLQVTYDGASQVAAPGEDPTGRAAALAELPEERPTGPGCGSGWQTRPAARVDVACDLPMAGRTAYWPGRGWAEDGSTWLVVSVERLEVTGMTTPAGRRYDIEDATGRADAADLEPADYGPTSLGGTLVLDGSTRALRLGLDVTGTPDGSADPRTVQVSTTVPVPE